MAQAKTLLESITSAPGAGDAHATKNLGQPSFLQNTTASPCTMNVDAPHIYAPTKTGSTNGNLIQTVPRTLLRQVYDSAVSNTSVALLAENSSGVFVDTGANVKVAIANLKYIEAGTNVTTSCAVTGTLTTATTARVAGLAAQAHVDNGGDELLLDVTVADVDGTMTLTEVLVVNKMRDYAVGNTIVFVVPDQDGSVVVQFTAVAGDLGDSSIELTELYVSANASQTIKIQAAQPCQVVFDSATPDFSHSFDMPTSALDLTADVVVGSGEITPFEVSTFKCATSATTFTFNSLI